MSKSVRWVVLAVAAVVVVVGGGVLVIRHVQGGSKPKLTLPTVTAPSGSIPPLADGVWKVSKGSTAGYRVLETLFGLSNTAIGRTSAVTGSITISGTAVTTGSFTVDLTKVSSDRSERDGQFQGRVMNTAKFPTATFKLTEPIKLSPVPGNGVKVSEPATGMLNLHGVTKSETFPVAAQRNGSVIQVQGSIPITFADWNISNPSGGPATTGDSGSLEFLLNLSHA